MAGRVTEEVWMMWGPDSKCLCYNVLHISYFNMSLFVKVLSSMLKQNSLVNTNCYSFVYSNGTPCVLNHGTRWDIVPGILVFNS